MVSDRTWPTTSPVTSAPSADVSERRSPRRSRVRRPKRLIDHARSAAALLDRARPCYQISPGAGREEEQRPVAEELASTAGPARVPCPGRRARGSRDSCGRSTNGTQQPRRIRGHAATVESIPPDEQEQAARQLARTGEPPAPRYYQERVKRFVHLSVDMESVNFARRLQMERASTPRLIDSTAQPRARSTATFIGNWLSARRTGTGRDIRSSGPR